MILQRAGNRTVTGLPGWEVEEKFPYGLEYREGGRVLEFDCERAGGPGVSIILYDEPGRKYWQPPHRDQPLTAAEMHPILVRVTAAVTLLGIRPIWETNPPQAERTDWPVIWAEVKCVAQAGGVKSPMDEDLEAMSREALIAEVRKLRQGIRTHRDSTGHELCWHHPALWGLLPEKTDPIPIVPDWPLFFQGCIRYRQSLDEQAPDAPRTREPFRK